MTFLKIGLEAGLSYVIKMVLKFAYLFTGALYETGEFQIHYLQLKVFVEMQQYNNTTYRILSSIMRIQV